MLPDHVLEDLCTRDEPRAGLLQHRLRELGSVAGTLCRDSDLVELEVGRPLVQPAHSRLQAVERPGGDRVQGDRLVRPRGVGGSLESIEKPEVAAGRHRLEERRASLVPLGHEPPAKAAERAGVGVLQDGRVHVEVLQQDVEIANLAEQYSEPLQLRAERLRPGGIDQRPCLTQERTRPACRDPGPVQRLGIGSEPDPWVVRE